MLVRIHDEILRRYPHVQIGYLVAEVNVAKTNPYVEKLKEGLEKNLEVQGMNATSYVVHPSISLWRKIYEEDFGVRAKTYRSSIEALLKRVLTGRSLWNICNIVDLYNCISIMTLLPMGGYDLDKIAGDIQIRFAERGEMFLGLGERVQIQTEPNHVVYADQERVMCWLWNHKDSATTCIDGNTKSVIFFIDGFESERVQSALQLLSMHLRNIQCLPLQSGILNHISPKTDLG